MSPDTEPDGRHLLGGVVVPLTTPIDGDGNPDPAAAQGHLKSLAAAGVTKLLLLGTNGEGPAFDQAESALFAAEVSASWRVLTGADAVVLVAVFGTSTMQTLRRAETLLEGGPDALVVPPPHYFHYQADELVGFYRDMASIGAPIILYNSPRYTGNPITEPVLRAAAEMRSVVGIKDSGCDDNLLLAAVRIAEARPSFATSQGNERRLAWALQHDAAGITPGLSNIAPRTCLDLVAAVRSGAAETASALQAKLDALAEIHRIRPGVACMKAALSILGLFDSPPAAPIREYSDAELVRLRVLLAGASATLIGDATY